MTPAKKTASRRSELAQQAAAFASNLQRLHQGLGGELSPVLEQKYGIDFKLYIMLRHIDAGCVHPGGVSKTVKLPKSVVTRYLDELVKLGLLERSLDRDDSRRIKLTLTSAGRRIIDEASRVVQDVVGARLQRLPKTKRAAFLEAFAQISANEEPGC